MSKKQENLYNYADLDTVDGGTMRCRVDYLVLATFRPKENMQEDDIVHLDGNTLNDCLDNLMWKSEYDARYTLNRLSNEGM
jgi:hypothetical protein